MFFGLSMRQFVFSILAVGIAVLLYFVLKPFVGMETVSWMCILGAAPFAAMGFISYHGMTAEQFLWAWLRSELLEPKEIRFESVNLYYEVLRGFIEKSEKGGVDRHDKDTAKSSEAGQGTVQGPAQGARRGSHQTHLAGRHLPRRK
jgi:hypothetical protein